MATEDTLVSYGVDDIEAARRKRNVFIIWFAALGVAVVAGALAMASLRQLVWTIAVSIVGGGAMIYAWDVAGAPVLRYMHFLSDQRRGLTRVNEGAFIAWGDVSVRDGVSGRELLLDVDGETLQFFLDIKKERPALEEGRRVEIVTHNKAVIAMRLAGGK